MESTNKEKTKIEDAKEVRQLTQNLTKVQIARLLVTKKAMVKDLHKIKTEAILALNKQIDDSGIVLTHINHLKRLSDELFSSKTIPEGISEAELTKTLFRKINLMKYTIEQVVNNVIERRLRE